MSDPLRSHDDFEAVIRIYSFDEGGRRTPAFNGIRWDFSYADEQPPSTLYMIWPDFFATDSTGLPIDGPLPVNVELRARMFIAADEMRQKVHRERIIAGTKFYCHEGARRVAEGVVTKITRLFALSE